ncbi:MAG TPA: NYN domain-containing protein [Fimbriimonadaceae bacterium]|nr:NYN domain-containing protein [Fimbriimonadaceae bacterium]
MPVEPAVKRAVAFFDGQNLFHAAKKAFGYTFPNYDPAKLAAATCTVRGWQLEQVRFYTGVPSALDNQQWHEFWSRKLLTMTRSGIVVFSRPLRYRNKVGPGGAPVLVGEEKGIDVRIAIDVLSCALRNHCDVALIFSQDQDLSEVADEVRVISRETDRWIKIASAYPTSPVAPNRRGINGTDWVKIDRATYDACIDPWDYRKDPP